MSYLKNFLTYLAEKIYHFKVADLYYYLVGKEETLSHIKSLEQSIFASTVVFEVGFYMHDLNGEVLYVGQTTQGFDTRYTQHLNVFRKTPSKKPWMKFNPTPDPIRLNPNDISQIKFKMTFYEAAVIELYEINLSGGLRRGNIGLYNKSIPISKKKFDYFKKNGNFNPFNFNIESKKTAI